MAEAARNLVQIWVTGKKVTTLYMIRELTYISCMYKCLQQHLSHTNRYPALTAM